MTVEALRRERCERVDKVEEIDARLAEAERRLAFIEWRISALWQSVNGRQILP